MNKWQMEGRQMPNNWRGVENDIPPGGKKSHLQHSIHPRGQRYFKGGNHAEENS
jgi:hypothetical protein